MSKYKIGDVVRFNDEVVKIVSINTESTEYDEEYCYEVEANKFRKYVPESAIILLSSTYGKTYKIIGGKSKEVIFNKLKGTMQEILLLTACEFPEEFFGCNIVGENNTDFWCLCAKEYYEGKSAIEVAAEFMTIEIRDKNNLYDNEVNWDNDDTVKDFSTSLKDWKYKIVDESRD